MYVLSVIVLPVWQCQHVCGEFFTVSVLSTLYHLFLSQSSYANICTVALSLSKSILIISLCDLLRVSAILTYVDHRCQLPMCSLLPNCTQKRELHYFTFTDFNNGIWCMCECMCVCVCAHVCTHLCACAECVCVCMYAYMCVCVCVCDSYKWQSNNLNAHLFCWHYWRYSN